MRSWGHITRALIATGTALALASCGLLNPGTIPSVPASSQPTIQGAGPSTGLALADAVTGDALANRVGELERLTLSADGNRGPGSGGFEAAASHIEAELARTGFYKIHRQPFTIQIPHPGASKLVDSSGSVIYQTPFWFSPGTPREGVTGRLVVPASGNGCQPDDWGPDVAGQIGMVDRGGCTFVQLNQSASAAGAAMVIVVNDREGGLYGSLDNLLPQYIPMTGVTKWQGRLLREGVEAAEVQLRFTFEQRVETFDTFNLFAETLTGDAEEVVMTGAHLDSVPEGPGMNDNGSGSMILFETALQLAALADPPRNKVRFAWWSGEELGLLGSMHWVNDLVEHDPETIRRLAAYVNVDMVASPNFVIGVYDGDQSTFERLDTPVGSAGLKSLYTSWFDRIGQPWIDAEMDDSSDHASFIPSGVPVGGLFTGSGDAKTAAEQQVFGGVKGKAYDPNYHQPADTLANVSLRALEINGKATAFVIGALADDTAPVNQGGVRARVPARAEGFGYAGTL